jgi:hypothetical protein
LDNGALLKRWYRDVKLLGLPRKVNQYVNRSTFLSLLIGFGADEQRVKRFTHAGLKEARDGYRRTRLEWPACCRDILLLKHLAWEPPPKVTVRVTVNGNGPQTTSEKPSSPVRLEVVRPTGLEPVACGLGNRCSFHLSYGRPKPKRHLN